MVDPGRVTFDTARCDRPSELNTTIHVSRSISPTLQAVLINDRHLKETILIPIKVVFIEIASAVNEVDVKSFHTFAATFHSVFLNPRLSKLAVGDRHGKSGTCLTCFKQLASLDQMSF